MLFKHAHCFCDQEHGILGQKFEKLTLFKKLKYKEYSTVKCNHNALGVMRFEEDLRGEWGEEVLRLVRCRKCPL